MTPTASHQLSRINQSMEINYEDDIHSVHYFDARFLLWILFTTESDLKRALFSGEFSR
jgi:hypothetical protein